MLKERPTIAAIATGPVAAPIGIVRISGHEAFSIAEKVFHGSGFTAASAESHRIYYGHVVDPTTGEHIDESLLLTFRAPRSYTGEDVIELSCHGGTYVMGRVLDAVIRAGAQHAEPGEFTLRAFLNGRLDLAQAEAVADLIQARSERALRSALRQRNGFLSSRIRRLYEATLFAAATLEALLEFDEEDRPPDVQQVRSSLERVREEVLTLIRTARVGRIVREGYRLAILGRPNVGKSTLLNALAGRDRAIVTSTPGTTRDVLSETITLAGWEITLYDTAGIRRARGAVEEEGVRRSLAMARSADGAIVVLDATTGWTAGDRRVLQTVEAPVVAIVWNKRDAVPPDVLEARVQDPRTRQWSQVVLAVSALTQEGLSALEECLVRHISQNEPQSDSEVVVHDRHLQALRSAEEHLQSALEILREMEPVVAAEELRLASETLGSVIGVTTPEDVVREVFSRFCVGK